MAKSATVPSTFGKLSELKKEFQDLLKAHYPVLKDSSTLLIPLFGSDHDSVVFLVLDDESLDVSTVTDEDILSWVKEKKLVGLCSLYGPAVWTLEEGAECLCAEGQEDSLWGTDEDSEATYLAEYDPYGIMSVAK